MAASSSSQETVRCSRPSALESPCYSVQVRKLSLSVSSQVTVSSSDGQEFEIPIEAASQAEMLKSFIEGVTRLYGPRSGRGLKYNSSHRDPVADAKPGEVIPLPTIKSDTLSKVLEWCKFHTDAVKETDGKAHKTKQEILDFDKEFVTCPHPQLFDTILVRIACLDVQIRINPWEACNCPMSEVSGDHLVITAPTGEGTTSMLQPARVLLSRACHGSQSGS